MKAFQLVIFLSLLGFICTRVGASRTTVPLAELKVTAEKKYFNLTSLTGGPAIGQGQLGGSQPAIGPGQAGNSQIVDGRHPRMTRTITDFVVAKFFPTTLKLPIPKS